MKAESPLIRIIEIKDRTGRIVGTKEVVTYQGLLSKAHDEGLSRVKTTLVQIPAEENRHVAIAKAEVETTKGVFEGLGDASPENVNSFIVPHLIRMAETRAKARALRDAVNIGVSSFEELDGDALAADSSGLASGAPMAAARSTRTGRGTASASRARPTPASPQSVDNGTEPMSEAQRRYLFRLLAGQGIENEAAHDFLIERLGVTSLSEVTKPAATALIDELLQSAPGQRTGGNGAATRLQR